MHRFRTYAVLVLAAIAVTGASFWALKGGGTFSSADPVSSATQSGAASHDQTPGLLLATGSTDLSDDDPDVGLGEPPRYLPALRDGEAREGAARSEGAKRATTFRGTGRAADEPWDEADEEEDPFTDPYEIAGRVLDDTGTGVPGVEVTAELRRLFTIAAREDEPAIDTLQSTLTGYAGAFRFPTLADGEYQLQVLPTERYTEASVRVRSGLGSVDLRVKRKLGELTVYGVVASTEGGALDGVQILPLTQPAAAVVSDGTGFYELTLERTAGRDAFPIRFRRDGFGDLRQDLGPAEYQGLDALPLDVFLEPVEVFGRVTGTVTDQDGAPVTGEQVKLFSRERNRSYTALI